MKAEKKRSQPEGYLQHLGSGVLGLPAFVVGLLVATTFCSFCIASSIAVWFRGLYGLVEWYNTATLVRQINRRAQAIRGLVDRIGGGVRE